MCYYIGDRWDERPPTQRLPSGTIALVRVPLSDVMWGSKLSDSYIRPTTSSLRAIAACIVSRQGPQDSIVNNVLRCISSTSIIGLDYTDGTNGMFKDLVKTETGGIGMLISALAQKAIVLNRKCDA